MDAHAFFKDFAGPLATALAAIVAAAVTATFARRQARAAELQASTARNKLKVDTFQIRFAAYRATIDVAEYVLHREILSQGELVTYYENRAKALQSEFLFTTDKYAIIAKLVELAYQVRFEGNRLVGMTHDSPRYEDKTKLVEDLTKELRSTYKIMPALFREELSLEFIDSEI